MCTGEYRNTEEGEGGGLRRTAKGRGDYDGTFAAKGGQQRPPRDPRSYFLYFRVQLDFLTLIRKNDLNFAFDFDFIAVKPLASYSLMIFGILREEQGNLKKAMELYEVASRGGHLGGLAVAWSS